MDHDLSGWRSTDACLHIVRFAADAPLSAAPIILTWAMLLRLSRRWAIPGALVVAAISAALTAGPDGGRDPARRWVAASAAGVTYVALGLGAGLITAFAAAAPPLLIEAVAGLALLGALGGALSAAAASEAHRDAAVVTLVVSASGVAPLGVSAPFWGLLAGLALLAVLHRRPA